MTNLNYRLLDADMFSYYPAPKFWIRWNRGSYPWIKTWKNINGFAFRVWKFGFTWHIGPGVHHNGRKFIGFWYDEYQEWLENGGWC